MAFVRAFYRDSKMQKCQSRTDRAPSSQGMDAALRAPWPSAQPPELVFYRHALMLKMI